jgi:hypothetical protein
MEKNSYPPAITRNEPTANKYGNKKHLKIFYCIIKCFLDSQYVNSDNDDIEEELMNNSGDDDDEQSSDDFRKKVDFGK